MYTLNEEWCPNADMYVKKRKCFMKKDGILLFLILCSTYYDDENKENYAPSVSST